MKQILFAILILIPVIMLSQSLGKERIDRLDKSIVKIMIDGKTAGTGFFVHKDGWIATCEHVIKSALENTNDNGVINFKKVTAMLRNGEEVNLEFLTYLVNNVEGAILAKSYDFFLLKSVVLPESEIVPLKLGTWSKANEGDVMYTSGYPLGIEHRLISQGILSTKYIEDRNFTITENDSITIIKKYKRDSAWMDITLNRGNSGGPVIKLGKTPAEDEVIGIASFILNPYGSITEKIAKDIKAYDKGQRTVDAGQYRGIGILSEAISNNSIGVSGVISIDYLSELLRRLNLL